MYQENWDGYTADRENMNQLKKAADGKEDTAGVVQRISMGLDLSGTWKKNSTVNARFNRKQMKESKEWNYIGKSCWRGGQHCSGLYEVWRWPALGSQLEERYSNQCETKGRDQIHDSIVDKIPMNRAQSTKVKETGLANTGNTLSLFRWNLLMSILALLSEIHFWEEEIIS